MTEHSRELLYCLPLEKRLDRFYPAPAFEERHGDLPRLEDLKPYFDKFYIEVEGVLELEGLSYIVRVFEPTIPQDCAYTLVDRRGVPQEKPSLASLTTDRLEEFWATLKKSVSRSESFPPTHESYLPLEFIPPRFQKIESGTKVQRTLRWMELKARTRAVIVGSPGAGKTTCLRMLAYDELKSTPDSWKSRLPLYIPLRILDHDRTLTDHVVSQLEGVVTSPQDFSALMNSGRLLLLLDGLDEISPQRRQRVSAEISKIARKHSQVGIIVSTRYATDDWRFPGFTHLEIQPFGEADVREWLGRRIERRDESAAWDTELMLFSSPKAVDLARNPLMLALAAGIVEGTGAVPSRRSELVMRYVEALLGQWDEARGVTRQSPHWFHRQEKMETLCRTAFRVKVEGKSGFLKSEFLSWESAWRDPDSAEKSLSVLWTETGICKPEQHNRNRWIFSHALLEDYLAAKYVVDRTDDALKSLADQANVLFVQLWPLVCELTQDASHLAKALLESETPAGLERCKLLARAVMGNAVLDRDLLNDVIRTLESCLVSVSKNLAFSATRAKEDQWLLTFTRIAPHALVDLNSYGELIALLTRGAVGQRKQEMAETWSTAENQVVRSIAGILQKPNEVSWSISENGNRLDIEGFGRNSLRRAPAR